MLSGIFLKGGLMVRCKCKYKGMMEVFNSEEVCLKFLFLLNKRFRVPSVSACVRE